MAIPLAAQSELLRTPLHDAHVAAGARMVDFAGWLMPIQYHGILAEHQAVRTSVGLFDLSHMGRFVFRGPDVTDWVQRLTTNDVAALADGQAQYSLLCNESGAILDDVVVYRRGDEYLMVVNASNRLKLLSHILSQQQTAGYDAQLRDATFDLAMIGVQGPHAQAGLQPLVDRDLEEIGYYHSALSRVAGVEAILARTGYTGEDGFELIVPARDAGVTWERLLGMQVDLPATAAGLGARDTLRMEAGMALYGHEIDESTNPFEARLGRVVKLDKGDFVGRDALRDLKERPSSRTLVGFQMEQPGVPRQGYRVECDAHVVGTVTSGGFSPTLKQSIGMAYVLPELSEPGQEVEVVIRERPTRARVVPLPFYRHRTRRKAPR